MTADNSHVNQPVPDVPQSGNKYFRFMRDPEHSWKPYRDAPMYDDFPALGTHKSTLNVPHPRAGDYVVQEESGSTYVMRPSDLDCFDDVEFDAMPSLETLVANGTVVEVPEHIRKADNALQDKMASLNADIIAEELYLEDLANDMEERRFGFPTKAARQAKAQHEELKPKFDAMCRKYAELETELQETVIRPLSELARSQSRHKGLAQVISKADSRRQQQSVARQNTQGKER